jgi:hypothetical protein
MDAKKLTSLSTNVTICRNDYNPHTAEESLRRLRAGRHSQVLSDHAGQAWELLLVLLPPHEGICVVDNCSLACRHLVRSPH